jgi:hypothetical protein
MTRPLTLAQAKARFPHRFTMEHVPTWASKPDSVNGYYKPQFRTDAEWYDNTLFHGESDLATRDHCCSRPTWPLGKGFADSPFKR